MKKIILALVLALVFTCLFVVGISATDKGVYYLVQDNTSELATTLKDEGKNVVGIADLYSNATTPLFTTLNDGDSVVIELAQNINYTPSGKTSNPTTTVAMRLEKAITVTVKFGAYSWWVSDDSNYCGFIINNTGATLRLIGGKLQDGENAVAVKDAGSYSVSTNTNDIDFYGGYVGIYTGCGSLYAENLIAVGAEELVYRNGSMDSSTANYEFKNCSLNVKKVNLFAIADKTGYNAQPVALNIDGGYYDGICLTNLLESSVKNATVDIEKATISGNAIECSIFIDSYKGVNEFNFTLDNVKLLGKYHAEGDSNLIVANNCEFKEICLKGDGSGGADAILTDCTYESVDFASKDGTLTLITTATCENAGEKTVLTKDGSTPDAEYTTQNPALGHNIDNPTGVHYDNYFSVGAYTGLCSRCNLESKETTPSAPAFITSKGLSSFDDGETVAVAQGFTINKDMVKYLGEGCDYGVLAAVNAGEEAIAPSLDSQSVLSASLKEGNYVVTNIKVASIPLANKTTNIVFCMYVVQNDKTYYVSNAETGESIVGLSYEDVVEINSNK